MSINKRRDILKFQCNMLSLVRVPLKGAAMCYFLQVELTNE